MRKIVWTGVILAAETLLAQTERAETNEWAEARIIMLTQYGLEPKQITVKPGPLRLILRSRIGGANSWQVAETGKTALKASFARGSKPVVRDVQVFTAGEYELTIPAFPQWKCVIRVQP